MHFRLVISIVACSLLVRNGRAATTMSRNFMDNVNVGIKLASQMLGFDTASDVANLVSKAFSKNILQQQNQQPVEESSSIDETTSRYQHQDSHDKIKDKSSEQITSNGQSHLSSAGPSSTFLSSPTLAGGDLGEGIGLGNGLLGGLLRVMGLDSAKLGALVVNGIIFIAQMIGKSLTGPVQQSPEPLTHQQYQQSSSASSSFGSNFETPNDEPRSSRNVRSGSPMDWILTNPSQKLNSLLVDVRDKNLPQRLAKMISDFEEVPGEADCVKLLLCKSAPFLWSMQKAVGERIDGIVVDAVEEVENDNRTDALFKYVPDVKEFKLHGDACEERYKGCQIYKN